MSEQKETLIEGPISSERVHESWFWERPENQGDLGYNRPEILHRCASIFGGRVKVYRTTEITTTTIYAVAP